MAETSRREREKGKVKESKERKARRERKERRIRAKAQRRSNSWTKSPASSTPWTRNNEIANLTQIERDRIRDFLNITQSQLDERNTEILHLNVSIEDAEDKHTLEMKMLQQKIKYLQHEHAVNSNTLRGEGLDALQLMEREFRANEMAMRKTQRALKLELKEQQRAHEEGVGQGDEVVTGTRARSG